MNVFKYLFIHLSSKSPSRITYTGRRYLCEFFQFGAEDGCFYNKFIMKICK